ncbi:hypothetical protein GCM10009605_43220 [Nocardiopsis composta]
MWRRRGSGAAVELPVRLRPIPVLSALVLGGVQAITTAANRLDGEAERGELSPDARDMEIERVPGGGRRLL